MNTYIYKKTKVPARARAGTYKSVNQRFMSTYIA